ncbi:MAG: phosphotransferase [Actinomycetota bacterium]
MVAVPARASEIDAAWLNEVDAEGVGRVAEVRVDDLGTGVGILGEIVRLTLTYEPGETGPATLIAKGASPSEESVGLCLAMGFYDREISFYRQLASDLDRVRVPKPYHVGAAEGTVPFVLLLEDISGARCPDQIAGIDAEDARRILETAAGLHATFWESPALHALDWLPPMNNPMYAASQALAEMRWDGFVEVWGPRVPPKALAAAGEVIPRYSRLLEWWDEQGNQTFAHTDCRAENYLFGGSAGDDTVTMVDFQLSTRHVGAWDVANLLGGSMTAEVRRSVEDDLVTGYHSTLVELGVTDYSLDQLWRDIRMSWLQQIFSSVVVSDLEGGNERGDDLMAELLTRPFLAADDHDAGALIAEL